MFNLISTLISFFRFWPVLELYLLHFRWYAFCIALRFLTKNLFGIKLTKKNSFSTSFRWYQRGRARAFAHTESVRFFWWAIEKKRTEFGTRAILPYNKFLFDFSFNSACFVARTLHYITHCYSKKKSKSKIMNFRDNEDDDNNGKRWWWWCFFFCFGFIHLQLAFQSLHHLNLASAIISRQF